MISNHRAKAWVEDQQDPDNWLVIPEFGIMPVEVGFKGFAFPIMTPSGSDPHFTFAIRNIVTSLRSEAKKRFHTLADLEVESKQVWERAARAYGGPLQWRMTSDEVFAVRYVQLMENLKHCVQSHQKAKGKSLLLLAHAAMDLAHLLVEKPIGPEERDAFLRERARLGGIAKMKKYSPARTWVVSEWAAHHGSYEGNKTVFAKHYARRVKMEHGVEITEKTIREVWLRNTPFASKRAGLQVTG